MRVSLEFFIGLANLSRANQPYSVSSYFRVFVVFYNAGVRNKPQNPQQRVFQCPKIPKYSDIG